MAVAALPRWRLGLRLSWCRASRCIIIILPLLPLLPLPLLLQLMGLMGWLACLHPPAHTHLSDRKKDRETFGRFFSCMSGALIASIPSCVCFGSVSQFYVASTCAWDGPCLCEWMAW
mmetsp:Transcript_47580/g.118977  ORF Transcript_47580/g.118977 Transcript_47580/m.118977 type:complete len:117 (+) Transcript_47580:1866-2216(+)